MRTLSSSLTFFYKYLLPVLWCAGFAVGWATIDFSHHADGPARTAYGAVAVFGAIGILCITGGVKRVERTAGGLAVSNYLRTIHLAAEEVAAVSSGSLLSPNLVWIDLKHPCPFGSRITFLPRARLKPGMGPHPLVMELQRELGLQPTPGSSS